MEKCFPVAVLLDKILPEIEEADDFTDKEPVKDLLVFGRNGIKKLVSLYSNSFSSPPQLP